MDHPHDFEFAIDQPGPSPVAEGVVQISGWCFHRRGAILHLQLIVNGMPHDARFSLDRPDVALVFHDAVGARRSGFIGVVALTAGDHSLALRIRVATVGVIETGVLARFTVASSHKSSSLLRFLVQKARARIRDGRGVPAWREVWTLLRQARDDHRTIAVEPENALPPIRVAPYERWLQLNQWTEAAARDLRGRLAAQNDLPSISIVTPVFRPDPRHFEATIQSVMAQVHPRWEWCLADDASRQPELTRRLNEMSTADSRVRFKTRSANGHISAASNSAAELATGDFLAFLDHDDLLSPDAIGEVALYLARHPDVDVLYSDDDKIDNGGRRHGPQFKPDWSPESLLSQMYFCHLLVVRRSLFNEVGGFRLGLEGSQDHDLALRVTERARRVGHLPMILYHWRQADGSTSVSGEAKPYSFEAGIRAVDDAFARRRLSARATRPQWAVEAGASLIAHEFPDDGPRVAILIATRNGGEYLERCLFSLAQTTYTNYEVVVLDDHSDDAGTLALLSRLSAAVIRSPEPRSGFNYAKMHNEAARQVDAEFLVFLNDDTEVQSPTWLSQLVGFGTMEGIGAVGARLLYPNGTIQHAGVLKGFNQGELALAFRGLAADDPGYLAAARVCRNYAAVTAACMLTRRQLFLDLGGLDEQRFPVSLNDIDYCYRLMDAGYRCVYAPGAQLLHHESVSRGLSRSAREVAEFRTRYRQRQEPYYNPNLSTANERFEVAPRRLARRTPAPVRALLFTHALDLTGAPMCQLEMAAGLAERQALEAHVVAPTDGPLRARFEALGIPVTLWPHAAHAGASNYEALQRSLAELIARTRPEVVYASTLETFFAVDAAARSSCPSIWNIRESEPLERYFRHRPEALKIARECFARPYRVVFDSNACRTQFARLDGQRNFDVIHTGLPLAAWMRELARWPKDATRTSLRATPSDVVLLTVGTVCPRKGQLDLIEALSRMPQLAAHVRCVVVGDRSSDYSDVLAGAVMALPADLRVRVTVLPETADVGRYYAAADAFVCTSRTESFPRVTLEAMAAGLPLVTTPVFGIREQLTHASHCLLYDPGDIATLAAHLEHVATEPERRQVMAAESRQLLAGLKDFDEMLGDFETTFREAAECG